MLRQKAISHRSDLSTWAGGILAGNYFMIFAFLWKGRKRGESRRISRDHRLSLDPVGPEMRLKLTGLRGKQTLRRLVICGRCAGGARRNQFFAFVDGCDGKPQVRSASPSSRRDANTRLKTLPPNVEPSETKQKQISSIMS